MWVQMGAGLVTATLGFTAFSFALRPVAERRRAERFFTIAALLLVGMAVCSVGLVAPVSDGRRQAVRLLIGTQALCGALAAAWGTACVVGDIALGAAGVSGAGVGAGATCACAIAGIALASIKPAHSRMSVPLP